MSHTASPMPEDTADRFTGHRNNGHAGLLGALLFVSAIEAGVVHLLVSPRLPFVSWILVLLSVQAVWWLIADYRQTIREPHGVDAQMLRIRAGRRWRADIPLALITDVMQREPSNASSMLSVTFLGAANVWVTLGESVPVVGPFGIVRRTSALALWVDEPKRFVHTLQERSVRVSGHPTPSFPPPASTPAKTPR